MSSSWNGKQKTCSEESPTTGRKRGGDSFRQHDFLKEFYYIPVVTTKATFHLLLRTIYILPFNVTRDLSERRT